MDNEFSLILEPTAFKKGLQNKTILASNKECSYLAKRLDLIGLTSFSVIFNSLESHSKTEFKIKGQLKATVVQSCILTLTPVIDEIEDEFIVRLIPGLTVEALELMDEEDEENDEDIEVLSEEGIDLGEISTQYLSMSLNPYPRAEEADIKRLKADGVTLLTEDEVKLENSPFKVLENLKNET